MPITLGSNITALAAQRQLSKQSGDLARTFERLSSGLRINRASDDSAGLSVATSLTANSRVLSQAVRNLNDGISLLNLAEGALESLTALGQRGQELAEQAASGTYTVAQRVAMQRESDAIVSEYNRIIQTTEFNGLKPLTSATFSVALQAGAGNANVITSAVGALLAGTVGDGTFATGVSYAAAAASNVATADINGDGILDLLMSGLSAASFHLGNGDGTFRAATTIAATNTLSVLEAADINNDGIMDLVGVSGAVGSSVSVFLGTGGGSFAAEVTFNGATGSRDIVLADLNRDNNIDIIQVNTGSSAVTVLLGNGNGSFGALANYASTPAASLGTLIVSDINGDGIVDIVDTNAGAADTVGLYIGNGNGTFRARVSFSAGDNPATVELADFNRDGKADLVTADNLSGTVSIFIGNGDGTFAARVSYTAGAGPNGLAVADMNGDGFIDIVEVDAGASDTIRILLGNGDGTFGSSSTSSILPNANRMAIGDFNRDGVVDAVSTGAADAAFTIHLGNTRRITSIGYANIANATDARSALTNWSAILSRISLERGAIGAAQSRIGFATTATRSLADNFTAAASRIMDADVAQDAADLVRLKILQNAATAVLAHTKQDAELVLKLLS